MSRATRNAPSKPEAFFIAPQPVERIVTLRVLATLAILSFMSTRLVHADHWIGDAGFWVPDLGGDWRQPVYLAALPSTLAWGLAALMVVSGLATLVGFRTRAAALVFGATLFYVALADRLSAFTVSKLAPVVALTIAMGSAGAAYSVDSWLRRRKDPSAPAYTHVSGGSVRFLQILLPVFYCASGICKAKGDWLDRGDVLFTHLHDSYQTSVSLFLANTMPAWSWTAMQWTTLIFEAGAPVLFWLRPTRLIALGYGVAMHFMIGLMFGPVKWFSLLMIAMLLAAYLPDAALARIFGALRARFVRREAVASS
ncbi:MAG: HTTM domain-containing protein [Myxococcales bacterium]|nr:HTTM domain-containing protein [Myxococcales bacterium]